MNADTKRHTVSNNVNEEQGNLDRATYSNTDGEIHVVFVRDFDSGDMLSCVTDNGKNDETDSDLIDMRGFDNILNRVDKKFGTNSHQGRGHEEQNDGAKLGEVLLFFVLLLIVDNLSARGMQRGWDMRWQHCTRCSNLQTVRE
ncbi:hypothetical protein HG530_004273 [Fusarium avenaceum]|nr:hypothetical protein HG530_004273 [Fusarium avenaceum]